MAARGPGAFQFTVTSIGVPTYVIDASTNLSDWTAIKTNTLTPYDYTEPNMLEGTEANKENEAGRQELDENKQAAVGGPIHQNTV